jgi:hypothetical protein
VLLWELANGGYVELNADEDSVTEYRARIEGVGFDAMPMLTVEIPPRAETVVPFGSGDPGGRDWVVDGMLLVDAVALIDPVAVAVTVCPRSGPNTQQSASVR